MTKNIYLGITALVVLALVIVFSIRFINKNPEPVYTERVQNMNADAYPLYAGVTWDTEQPSTFASTTGFIVKSIPFVDIADVSAVSMPFDKYYKDKLTLAGWKEDISFSAGGPGSSITAYKKGDSFIVVSYSTKFKGGKENEPVQCPCDTTLSVYSSTN